MKFPLAPPLFFFCCCSNCSLHASRVLIGTKSDRARPVMKCVRISEEEEQERWISMSDAFDNIGQNKSSSHNRATGKVIDVQLHFE